MANTLTYLVNIHYIKILVLSNQLSASYHPHPALPLKGEGKGGGGKRKFLSNQDRGQRFIDQEYIQLEFKQNENRARNSK